MATTSALGARLVRLFGEDAAPAARVSPHRHAKPTQQHTRAAPDDVARLERHVDGVEYLVHVVAAALLRAVEAEHALIDTPPGWAFVAVLRDGLAPFLAEIPGGSSVTRARPAGVRPGVCGFCGCTETQACPGGCGWANAERTICTRCDAELAALKAPTAALDDGPLEAPGGRQAHAPGRATSRPPAPARVQRGTARPARAGASRPAPTRAPAASRAGSAVELDAGPAWAPPPGGYADKILACLRLAPAAGLNSADIARGVAGREHARAEAGVRAALAVLVRRGALERDGRLYAVATHEAAPVERTEGPP